MLTQQRNLPANSTYHRRLEPVVGQVIQKKKKKKHFYFFYLKPGIMGKKNDSCLHLNFISTENI